MSTFTAYLDDQDLIRIQKGEEHILPFYLETNQGRLALIPVKTSSGVTDTGDYFLSLFRLNSEKSTPSTMLLEILLFSTMVKLFANPFLIKPSPIVERI